MPLTKTGSLVIVLIIAGSAHAQSAPAAQIHKKEVSNQALIRLVTVDRFAFGGIGFSGLKSAGQADYETILSRPSGLAEFETIYLVGNPQAVAYALVGIHRLKWDRYLELAESLRDSKELVLTQRGCLVSVEPLAAIIRHIDSGLYMWQDSAVSSPRSASPSAVAAR